MFEIPEAVWQAKYEGQFKESPVLWKVLDEEANEGRMERPLEMKCLLIDGETLTQRHGKDMEFVEGWQAPFPSDDEVRPAQKTKRFIGTSVELCQVNSYARGRPCGSQ